MPIDTASSATYATAFSGSPIGMTSDFLTGIRGSNPGPDRTFHEQLRMLHHASFVSFARVQDSVSIWIADNRGMQFLLAERGFRNVQDLNEELLSLARTPQANEQAIAKLGTEICRVLFGPISRMLDPERSLCVHCGPGLHHTPLSLLRVEDGSLLSERYRTVLAADFPSREGSEAAERLSSDSPFLFLDAGAARDCGGAAKAPCRDALAEPVDKDYLRLRFRRVDALTGAAATSEAFEHLASRAEGIHCRVAISEGAHGPQMQLAPAAAARDPFDGSNVAYLPLAVLRRKALGQCRLGVFDAKLVPSQPHESHQLWQRCRGALHHAGIANVLLPRWEVNSAVTHCFLGSFYARLLGGVAIDIAFRDAAATVRGTKGWEHPHYWAGFAHSVSHL
jgi:hypothetical protein